MSAISNSVINAIVYECSDMSSWNMVCVFSTEVPWRYSKKKNTNNILINFAYCYETSLDRFLKNIDTNYDIILSAILIYVKKLLFQTSPRPGVGNNGPEVPMSCRV